MRPRVPPGVLATALASVVLLAPAGRVASAQIPEPAPRPPPSQAAPVPDPGFLGNLGLSLSAAIPQGAFRRNVSAGLGLTGDLSVRLLRAGWLGLRLDGGIIWYGYETRKDRVAVAGIPIDVELTTENTIVQGGIGPQLRAAGYPLNADLYALVGFSKFATRTSTNLDPRDDDEPRVDLGSTVHLSDWSPSFTLGGEVNWTFDGDRQGFLVGIGIGLEYRRHGTTRYLNEDSITEVDGRTVFTPFETRADFWLIRIGLRGGTW